MSSPDEAPAEAKRPWWRFSPGDLVIPVLIVVVIVGVLELIPADQYMLLPGDAVRVEPMISVKGAPPVHPKGKLYLTDVTLYKVNHLLEELYGRLNPNAELYPAQQFSGGLTESQYIQANAALMTNSIDAAKAAALEVTRHYKPTFSTHGPQVVFIVPNTPAVGKLAVGDVITAIDGHTIHSAGEVPAHMSHVRPHAVVHLTIERNRHVRHLSLRTAAAPGSKGRKPFIGIEVQDPLVFPVKMSINAGVIGGPSAGLMFTLGLIERLEGRDITHGCPIAGTGTIDLNGNVGEIGGAKQKVIAAENVGAKYFFVPDVADNVNPAMSARDGITVVPVKTLRQAISYLNRIPSCKG